MTSAAAIASARAAFEAAGPDRPLERGGAAGMLALAYWSRGDLDDAYAAWSDAIANLELAGHRADVLGCSIGLADIRITQGRLHDARRIQERGLRIGDQPGEALRGTADMHVGLAAISCERNDLAAAKQHLEAAGGLGEPLGLPQNPYRLRVATARVREPKATSMPRSSCSMTREQRYDGDFFPEVRPIPAMRARVLAGDGARARRP